MKAVGTWVKKKSGNMSGRCLWPYELLWKYISDCQQCLQLLNLPGSQLIKVVGAVEEHRQKRFNLVNMQCYPGVNYPPFCQRRLKRRKPLQCTLGSPLGSCLPQVITTEALKLCPHGFPSLCPFHVSLMSSSLTPQN